jgi:HK97 family phage portal protein
MLKSYLQKFTKPKETKSSNYNYLDLFPMMNYDGENGGIDSYKTNPIVHRCVSLIANSASHIPWQLFSHKKTGSRELVSYHPILHMLRAPNPEKSGADFFIENISNLLLYGNSYMLLDVPEGEKSYAKLYNIHPSLVKQMISSGKLVGYEVSGADNSKQRYGIDPSTRKSRILHLHNYNPFSSNEGISALSCAAKAIHLHSRVGDWNKSLLKNSVRPSGALVCSGDNGHLTDEQFERLEKQFYENFSGVGNSGKPLILEGGLQWQETSLGAKFDKFIDLKDSTARDIAIAFNVPPQLMGINGDNTYSNMQEARYALWEENIIPLLDKYADALSAWFSYWYQDDFIIDFDKEAISALSERREKLWSKIAKADFMTINEKRAALGLKGISGGDVFAGNIEPHSPGQNHAKNDQ